MAARLQQKATENVTKEQLDSRSRVQSHTKSRIKSRRVVTRVAYKCTVIKPKAFIATLLYKDILFWIAGGPKKGLWGIDKVTQSL